MNVNNLIQHNLQSLNDELSSDDDEDREDIYYHNFKNLHNVDDSTLLLSSSHTNKHEIPSTIHEESEDNEANESAHASYLGRSRVFLDKHMTKELSNGVLKVFCSYCSKVWSNPASSSTGNYRKHLMKHHPFELAGKDTPFGQNTINDGVLNWILNSSSSPAMIDESFELFLYKCFRVEVNSMQLMMNTLELLDSQYETQLSRIHLKFRPHLKNPILPLRLMNFCAITFHHKQFTGSSYQSNLIRRGNLVDLRDNFYLTVSAHFIDDHWNLQNIVLSFTPLFGTPSKKNLSAQLSEKIVKFFDTSQITNILSTANPPSGSIAQDNSSHCLSKYPLFCVATSISDAMQESMIHSKNLMSLKKLRTILSEIYSSPQNMEALIAINNQLVSPTPAGTLPHLHQGRSEFHVIQLDIAMSMLSSSSSTTSYDDLPPPHWRITLQMLSLALDQRVLIENFLNQLRLSNMNNQSINFMNPNDWNELGILRKSLASVETTINAIANNRFDKPSIHSVLPSLSWLYDMLMEANNIMIPEPSLLVIYASLRDSIGIIYNSCKNSHVYAIATALDPRLKLEYFEEVTISSSLWTNNDRNDILNDLGQLYSFYINNQLVDLSNRDMNLSFPQEPIQDVNTTSQLSDFPISMNTSSMNTSSMNNHSESNYSHGDISENPLMFLKRRKVTTRSELEVYFNTPTSTVDNQDPLMWWKEHSSSYPVLSRIVRDVFAIPSSIAFTESVFSSGLDMIHQMRRKNQIVCKESYIEKLLCLKSWNEAIKKS